MKNRSWIFLVFLFGVFELLWGICILAGYYTSHRPFSHLFNGLIFLACGIYMVFRKPSPALNKSKSDYIEDQDFWINEWETYRKKKIAYYVLLMLLIPIIEGMSSSTTPEFYSAALFIWVILIFWFTFHIDGFLCPRCRKRFFVGGRAQHIFASSCQHCDLQKWAPQEQRKWFGGNF